MKNKNGLQVLDKIFVYSLINLALKGESTCLELLL